MKKQTRSRLRAGLTLVEVIVASVISTAVIFSALQVYLLGIEGWTRGSEQIRAETQARLGVRVISDELREAMAVTIAPGGQSITYRLPQKDGTGAFTNPVVWDGVTRRIYFNAGTIRVDDGVNDRILVRNILTTDPSRANAAYQIFTPGPGSIVRQINVQVIARTNDDSAAKAVGRRRETLFLRNIPVLSQ